MDSLISEMEKLLVSGRENYDIQDFIGECEGKNIDDLLIEADKIISETLLYFQTTSNSNEVKSSKDVENIVFNSNTKSTLSKSQQNETKKVVFNLKNNAQNINIPEKHAKISDNCGKLTIDKCIKNKEKKKKNICSSLKKCTTPEFKVPEVSCAKTKLQVSTAILENHNRLQNICNKHDKLANNIKVQDDINKLKMIEELKYYELRNNELEKSLIFKEQEIQQWKNRYHQLNEYCELFLKKNIEENLKSYDCQINEIVIRNRTRESQLHTIINNLLEEIEQSHLHYRIQLLEKNEQIHKYLDQIEKLLDNVYRLRNDNTKR